MKYSKVLYISLCIVTLLCFFGSIFLIYSTVDLIFCMFFNMDYAIILGGLAAMNILGLTAIVLLLKFLTKHIVLEAYRKRNKIIFYTLWGSASVKTENIIILHNNKIFTMLDAQKDSAAEKRRKIFIIKRCFDQQERENLFTMQHEDNKPRMLYSGLVKCKSTLQGMIALGRAMFMLGIVICSLVMYFIVAAYFTKQYEGSIIQGTIALLIIAGGAGFLLKNYSNTIMTISFEGDEIVFYTLKKKIESDREHCKLINSNRAFMAVKAYSGCGRYKKLIIIVSSFTEWDIGIIEEHIEAEEYITFKNKLEKIFLKKN